MQAFRAKKTKQLARRPITWFIDRSGHVNVNSAERLAAMRALVAWTEGQPIQSVEDGTRIMSPESIAARTSHAAAGNITLIRPLYGNIYTNFIADDLARIGVGIGDAFEIIHRDQTFPITFAKAYSDVPYGEWVAFMDSEGHVQISRNYANAAEKLSAESGDPLLLNNPTPE
jgi:S-adenosylmethionine hydrolase